MKMRKTVVNETPLRIYLKEWLLVSGQNFDNSSLSGGSGQLGGVFSLNAIESSSHVCPPVFGDKEVFWC